MFSACPQYYSILTQPRGRYTTIYILQMRTGGVGRLCRSGSIITAARRPGSVAEDSLSSTVRSAPQIVAQNNCPQKSVSRHFLAPLLLPLSQRQTSAFTAHLYVSSEHNDITIHSSWMDAITHPTSWCPCTSWSVYQSTISISKLASKNACSH